MKNDDKERFEKALEKAKVWSLDEENNYDEAVVCQSIVEKNQGIYSIASVCTAENWVKARFIKGERVK